MRPRWEADLPKGAGPTDRHEPLSAAAKGSNGGVGYQPISNMTSILGTLGMAKGAAATAAAASARGTATAGAAAGSNLAAAAVAATAAARALTAGADTRPPLSSA